MEPQGRAAGNLEFLFSRTRYPPPKTWFKKGGEEGVRDERSMNPVL